MKKKTIAGLIAIVAIAVVIFAGCIEEPTKTYSNFGFSFEYPADMELHEEGILSAEANEESGAVYCEKQELIIIVKWMRMEKVDTSDLIKGTNNYLADMDAEVGVTVFKTGHGIRQHIGHSLVEQLFAAVKRPIGSSDMLGSIGSWWCDESGRMFRVIVLVPEQELSVTRTIYGDGTIVDSVDAPKPSKDPSWKAYEAVIKSFRCH
jgi:hypothetical protein